MTSSKGVVEQVRFLPCKLVGLLCDAPLPTRRTAGTGARRSCVAGIALSGTWKSVETGQNGPLKSVETGKLGTMVTPRWGV